MLKSSKITLAVLLALGATAVAAAQSNPPAAPDNPTPTFRANVVSRTARAVTMVTAAAQRKSISKVPTLCLRRRAQPRCRASAVTPKS
jgi:hypothetical protein